jgi:hypothetical protein
MEVGQVEKLHIIDLGSPQDTSASLVAVYVVSA